MVAVMHIIMITDNQISLFKLLQVSSPSLPVGAYSYSQGLEWAVECGWVTDATSFRQWLKEQLTGTITQQDLPLFLRMYYACESANVSALTYWDAMALAMRETSELRHEELQRGRATALLLEKFGIDSSGVQSQIAALAVYCVKENITVSDSMAGYAYSWLDSQVTAGIKLVPVGQSEGQLILYTFSGLLKDSIATAQVIPDDEIGYSSPALSIASSLHETQYCRLFRS